MTKYKLGDMVTVRPWSDMVNEFRLDNDGDIVLTNNYFLKAMRHYCGGTYEIKSASIANTGSMRTYSCYKFDTSDVDVDIDLENHGGWNFTDEALESTLTTIANIEDRDKLSKVFKRNLEFKEELL